MAGQNEPIVIESSEDENREEYGEPESSISEPSSVSAGSNVVDIISISDSDESAGGEVVKILNSSDEETPAQTRCFGGPALKKFRKEKPSETIDQENFDKIRKFTVRENFAVDALGAGIDLLNLT